MAEEIFDPAECSTTWGYPLGKVLEAFNAKIAVISTPERGPAPSIGSPDDFSAVGVMSTLQRAGSFTKNKMVSSYDFKGSSSAKDCGRLAPDKDMTLEQWRDPEAIEGTQWFRYWMGRGRGTIQSLIETTQPTTSSISVPCSKSPETGSLYAEGVRLLIVASISGGPITQTEAKNIPNVIKGAQGDLTTMDVELQGEVFVYWLHFETVEDFLKALQGYGGLCLGIVQNERNIFDLPGEWVDGEHNPKYDMLRDAPGEVPDVRRMWLMRDHEPKPDVLSSRLFSALSCRDTMRAKQLLAQRASPSEKNPAGFTPLLYAAWYSDAGAIEAIIAAGADDKDRTETLAFIQHQLEEGALSDLPMDNPVVKERIDSKLAALRGS